MEGRTRRLLRHRRSQQRTALKPSTEVIELGRRTARGYRNPTNYKLRMLLIAGGLDAFPHTQLCKAVIGLVVLLVSVPGVVVWTGEVNCGNIVAECWYRSWIGYEFPDRL